MSGCFVKHPHTLLGKGIFSSPFFPLSSFLTWHKLCSKWTGPIHSSLEATHIALFPATVTTRRHTHPGRCAHHWCMHTHTCTHHFIYFSAGGGGRFKKTPIYFEINKFSKTIKHRVRELIFKWEMRSFGASPRKALNSISRNLNSITLIEPLWKTVWRFLKKLGIKPPYDPAIQLLGIYPEETKIEKDTCIPLFIAALFTIARTWKQPRCPLTDE